jgi:hypothetical protein
MDSKRYQIEEERIASTPEYYESLKCMICFSICDDPIIVSCCQTLVCKGCIFEWLENSKTCPKCKAGKPSIQNPDKFICRLFDNLKIKCSYYTKGCTEALPLETLNSHELKCKYNGSRYTTCDKCNSEVATKNLSAHNCFEHLKKIISDLKITDLQSSRDICFVRCPIDKKKLVEEIINNLKIHEHVLQKATQTIMQCDLCGNEYENQQTYSCRPCDFDMCIKCYEYCFNKHVDTR